MITFEKKFIEFDDANYMLVNIDINKIHNNVEMILRMLLNEFENHFDKNPSTIHLNTDYEYLIKTQMYNKNDISKIYWFFENTLSIMYKDDSFIEFNPDLNVMVFEAKF
jgi:hypothetical protein